MNVKFTIIIIVHSRKFAWVHTKLHIYYHVKYTILTVRNSVLNRFSLIFFFFTWLSEFQNCYWTVHRCHARRPEQAPLLKFILGCRKNTQIRHVTKGGGRCPPKPSKTFFAYFSVKKGGGTATKKAPFGGQKIFVLPSARGLVTDLQILFGASRHANLTSILRSKGGTIR